MLYAYGDEEMMDLNQEMWMMVDDMSSWIDGGLDQHSYMNILNLNDLFIFRPVHKALWSVLNTKTDLDFLKSIAQFLLESSCTFYQFTFGRVDDHAGSYVNVVNGSSTTAVPGPYISSASALVLDDSCVVECDLSKYDMGKVKDVNSTPNLQTLLMDKGFFDVKLMYLGGMWVMFEFDKVETKVNMMQHIGVKSWFHIIQDAVHDFVSDEGIVWVDIEGISLNVWSRETFMRIAHSSFSEEVSGDDSESDVEEVSETIFGDNSSSPNNNSNEMGKQHSEDLFKIYDILKKQTEGEMCEVSSSLSHPPGFTLEVSEIQKENDQGAEEFSLVNAKKLRRVLIRGFLSV
nr:RNA-directed DNA polymerase, eukaryota [Tanacetum cinerariifolium]